MIKNCIQALIDLGWVEPDCGHMTKTEVEEVVGCHIESVDIDSPSPDGQRVTISARPGTAITALCVARMALRANPHNVFGTTFRRDGKDRQFAEMFFQQRYVRRALRPNGT